MTARFLLLALLLGIAAPAAAQQRVLILPPNVVEYCTGPGAGGAAVSATCPASTYQTEFLWKVEASCSSPTSTVGGVITITGLSTGTVSYEFNEVGGGAPWLNDGFPPVQATGMNVAIVATVPAISSGGACAVCVYCSAQ